MSTSADTRPPVLPSPPGPPGRRDPVHLQARRRERRRVLAWGLGISAFLHLLLLFFASRTWIPITMRGSSAAPAAGPVTSSLPEMQALRLRLTDDASSLTPEEVPETPPEERRPLEERTLPRRTTVPVAPVVPTTPDAERGERVTEPEGRTPATPAPADRLQPGLVDPRLWERAEAPPVPEKSDFEKAKERVYARIEMLNDSAVADAAAASRATDWTFTDKDGKRWGVSPGKVHLGGVTLPLPFGFSPPPDQAKENRERAARAGEIKDHADRARVRGTFDEQVRSTRAERDRERAAKKDSTAGGTE